LAAIAKAGSTTDLAAIKKHLQEDTVETAMGPIRFDEKGDVVGAGFKMYEIKGGKFTEVAL
jgi:branched-chain amino acid transport system substrate-binding protein